VELDERLIGWSAALGEVRVDGEQPLHLDDLACFARVEPGAGQFSTHLGMDDRGLRVGARARMSAVSRLLTASMARGSDLRADAAAFMARAAVMAPAAIAEALAAGMKASAASEAVPPRPAARPARAAGALSTASSDWGLMMLSLHGLVGRRGGSPRGLRRGGAPRALRSGQG
jgi:hypothetical protein